MFVVVPKHRFWWPVTVAIPDPEKAGAVIAATFEVQFEALSIEQGRKIDAERDKLPPEERSERHNDWLFEVAKDWRDIVDEARQPIPFGRESFAAFLGLAWHRNAVLDAYREAMTGQAARLGNSDAPPGR